MFANEIEITYTYGSSAEEASTIQMMLMKRTIFRSDSIVYAISGDKVERIDDDYRIGLHSIFKINGLERFAKEQGYGSYNEFNDDYGIFSYYSHEHDVMLFDSLINNECKSSIFYENEYICTIPELSRHGFINLCMDGDTLYMIRTSAIYSVNLTERTYQTIPLPEYQPPEEALQANPTRSLNSNNLNTIVKGGYFYLVQTSRGINPEEKGKTAVESILYRSRLTGDSEDYLTVDGMALALIHLSDGYLCMKVCDDGIYAVNILSDFTIAKEVKIAEENLIKGISFNSGSVFTVRGDMIMMLGNGESNKELFEIAINYEDLSLEYIRNLSFKKSDGELYRIDYFN